MHKLNIPSENERWQAQAQALVQEKGKILILVPVQALVFLLALRLFSRWNKSCYALFVLALTLSTLMKTRLYRTTNNETSKRIWMHITTSLRKILLCLKMYKNVGMIRWRFYVFETEEILVFHSQYLYVRDYDILLYVTQRKIWERFQSLNGLRASPPFRQSPLRKSEKISENKNVNAPREV